MAKIKDWPAGERPRERLIKEGPQVLSDAQLLAILLRTGSDQANAVQLAIGLLDQFHELNNFANLSIKELCSIRGIGPAKAAQLKAAFELGRRSLVPPVSQRTKIHSSQDIFRHFSPTFRHLKKEIFKIVLLDQKNKIIRDVLVSEGSLTLTVVHPREVFNPAVRDSAASVVFLHNHPSGDPTPSSEDRELTRRLVAAGDLMGIQVLDHLIIGEDQYFSFSDAGYIRSPSPRVAVSEKRT
ncbi:MAG: DNA repair protein RadC [Candidatus Manganitrophus sp. SA1]|jgi:DNA repair protein RadC|nr:DNA repair protein RadC [Candidatus Manganitrophus morganii]